MFGSTHKFEKVAVTSNRWGFACKWTWPCMYQISVPFSVNAQGNPWERSTQKNMRPV